MSHHYRDLVWQDKTLKGGKLLVMLALAEHADAGGECYPRMALLMEKTRLTDRQLRRVLNTLHADGLICIEERAIGRGKRPHYKLFPYEKADILSEEKRTFIPPLEEKADISDNKSGHFVHEKADISGAIQSHARREPITEPKEEREIPRARGTHEFFDPRKFINGRIPVGTGSTPAEVFYEVHTLKDDRQVLSSFALATISEQVNDLARWRAVVSAWELSSFKATNILGQLEWYREGIPERNKSPAMDGASKNGVLTEAQKGTLITRARNAQKEIRTIEQFGGKIDPALHKDIELAKGYGLI